MKLRNLVALLMLFVAIGVVPCRALDVIPCPQSVELTQVVFDMACKSKKFFQ